MTRFLCFTVLLLLFQALIFPQRVPTSTVTIYVTDRMGRALKGAEVSLTKDSNQQVIRASQSEREGEYVVNTDYGDYLLEARLPGFIRQSEEISINNRTNWFPLGLRVGTFGNPSKVVSVRGKVTLGTQEPKPRWIRMVSVFGSENRAALINEDGTYRLEQLEGDGPYAVWVVAAERLCGMRSVNLEELPRPATLDIVFTGPCSIQK